MRRLIRFIVLVAVFLGGYYLGHLPGSPDVVGHIAKLCRRVGGPADQARAEAPAQAPAETPADQTSLTEKVLSSLLGKSAQPFQQEDPPQGER